MEGNAEAQQLLEMLKDEHAAQSGAEDDIVKRLGALLAPHDTAPVNAEVMAARLAALKSTPAGPRGKSSDGSNSLKGSVKSAGSRGARAARKFLSALSHRNGGDAAAAKTPQDPDTQAKTALQGASA